MVLIFMAKMINFPISLKKDREINFRIECLLKKSKIIRKFKPLLILLQKVPNFEAKIHNAALIIRFIENFNKLRGWP